MHVCHCKNTLQTAAGRSLGAVHLNVMVTGWAVLFSASVCVVKVDGAPYLCKTDEVGEVCVSSNATGTAYYGLPGVTRNVFEVCTCALQWSLRASLGARGRGPASLAAPPGQLGVGTLQP